MKRGYYVLLAGGVIFSAGLILTATWALPLAKEIQKGTAILQGRDVRPGQSVTVTVGVEDMSKPLSIVISSGSRGDMNAKVFDPNGEQIFDESFAEAIAEATMPTVPGSYELVIANQSLSNSTVDSIFGQIPGTGQPDIDTEAFREIIVGLAIVVAGIMVLVGGLVVVVLDRHK